jgi:hypothetical protein
LFVVESIIGNGTRALSMGTTVARGRTTDISSAICRSCERSTSGTRNPPSDGDTDGGRVPQHRQLLRDRSLRDLCQIVRT